MSVGSTFQTGRVADLEVAVVPLVRQIGDDDLRALDELDDLAVQQVALVVPVDPARRHAGSGDRGGAMARSWTSSIAGLPICMITNASFMASPRPRVAGAIRPHASRHAHVVAAVAVHRQLAPGLDAADGRDGRHEHGNAVAPLAKLSVGKVTAENSDVFVRPDIQRSVSGADPVRSRHSARARRQRRRSKSPASLRPMQPAQRRGHVAATQLGERQQGDPVGNAVGLIASRIDRNRVRVLAVDPGCRRTPARPDRRRSAAGCTRPSELGDRSR